MKIYLSGSHDAEWDKHIARLCGNRLLSFAYVKDAEKYLHIAKKSAKPLNVLIDSGAFTAWSKGKNVSLDNLIAFNLDCIKKYSHIVNFYFINLDVIAGRKDRKPTEKELKDAMSASMSNFVKMQKALGDVVLPVYHRGEPVWFRDLMFKYTDYVCYSPLVGTPENMRAQWAREMQIPGKKIHGLATTGIKIMRTVDWYSIDSSSWLLAGATGGILLPQNGSLQKIAVSVKSPTKSKFDAHYDTMVAKKQEYYSDFVNDMGFDITTLRSDYKERCKLNAQSFINLQIKKSVCIERGLF